MIDLVQWVGSSVLIGAGATLVMDGWAWLQRRLWQIPSLNYSMVGRWLGHLPKGQLVHQGIANSAPIPGETVIGWVAHYLIGMVFAAGLLMVVGQEWALSPTLLPALLTGVITVLAPYLILQPGMGAGIAASKTPNPNLMRFRSLVAHISYGVGLYIAAVMVSRMWG
ncbi:DUF2938 domain-containing protein [Photobacterium atrarenae]|uniref:DUF2938 domain-containing protein n=1 Tax=Photobacterium atrarenae TaxID=865757 RepID=A0ABY5GPI1_9GAMM|nr:DUF2938 domain-containing protein [Photobacterium atrarenae]UTV30656.1 DUF2938 domain-containing protein [Photobacterium atrarenae]